jgi:carboxymethylenebutenolidase
MRRLGAFDRDQAFGDFAAVLSWVRGLPECNGRVVGLGVCLGGPFCFVGAAKGLLDGVVTWHGSRLDSFVGEAEAMRCPMALHFGESDRVVPMDAVERVRVAFAGRDDVQVFVHPGADHGFSHSSGPTWDPAAAAAGMASVHKMLAG